MLGALIYTRIIWAQSPTTPQIPGVTPGSPLGPWCSGTPYGEVRDNCDVQSRTIIMSIWILTTLLFIMTMVGNMVDLEKKWRSPLKGFSQTSLIARIPNTPICFKNSDVGLLLQLRMLEFMNSMSQELQVGKKMKPIRQNGQVLHNARC